MTALSSLPVSEPGRMPEEIERAIRHLTQVCLVAPGLNDVLIANRNIRNGVEALYAAILSHLASAERCCDSYANENQQFHDRFTAAEAQLSAALARAERAEKALEDLLGDFHESSDAHAKIRAALTEALDQPAGREALSTDEEPKL